MRRPPGRRLRIVAIAATVVVIAGYGGARVWSALVDDDAGSSRSRASGFVGITSRLGDAGRQAIDAGVDLRILVNGHVFVDVVSRSLEQLQSDRALLERRAAPATGARAEILRSALRAVDGLETGLVQWRDGIVNLQLGNAATGEAVITSAIQQLEADAARWEDLPR